MVDIEKKYKLDFVNQGNKFEIPILKVRQEIDILDYLKENIKENDTETKRRYLEYVEAVYLALSKVDKNVTREMVQDEFSLEGLMAMYFRIRFRGNKIYTCPHCEKKISFWELIEELNKIGGAGNFRKPKQDTTTKKEKS